MTSRYLKLRLGLGIISALALPAAVLAAARPIPTPVPTLGPEAVTNLTFTDRLATSGTLDVTEQIDYNFGTAAPHPITQTFPHALNDENGNQLLFTFRLLSASAGDRPLNLKPATSGGLIRLTLPPGAGPATTPRHYTLHFTLSPIVLKGPEGDVLQLSATGLAWLVPINHVTLTLDTPGLTAQNLTCITGNGSATSSNCRITTSGHSSVITTDAPLAPGEALSLYCGFPGGSFHAYLTAGGGSFAPFIVAGLLIILAIVAAILLARRPPAP